MGSAAAATDEAPVLLTRANHLPEATGSALDALEPTEVVLLGGRQAVSEDVADAVAESTGAEIIRVGGDTRYETAELLTERFPGPVDLAFVASGLDYPDALTGAAIAGSRELPILLTRGDRLPEVTGTTLDRLDPSRILVLGGPVAVAEDVLDSLEQFLP